MRINGTAAIESSSNYYYLDKKEEVHVTAMRMKLVCSPLGSTRATAASKGTAQQSECIVGGKKSIHERKENGLQHIL